MVPEKHACPRCDTEFMSLDLLDSHIGAYHPEYARPTQDPDHPALVPDNIVAINGEVEAIFQCAVCGKSYKKVGFLDRHMVKEHKPKRAKRKPAAVPTMDPALKGILGEPRPVGRGGSVVQEEEVRYQLHVMVSGDVTVTVTLGSPMSFSMLSETLTTYGVPFTSTQP
jgi:uncharacterized C2H2 Zn-finger protein